MTSNCIRVCTSNCMNVGLSPVVTSIPVTECGDGRKKVNVYPFIFNDESTGSCICLRLDLYMSRVLLLCVSFIFLNVLHV
jgi:hypothetical protein